MRIRTGNYCIAVCAAAAAAIVGGCNRPVDLGPVSDSGATAIRAAFTSKQIASGEKAVEKPTGTGWATLRGQFVFDGAPPEPQPYSVTKEMDVCAPGGKAPLQETIVVDSG